MVQAPEDSHGSIHSFPKLSLFESLEGHSRKGNLLSSVDPNLNLLQKNLASRAA